VLIAAKLCNLMPAHGSSLAMKQVVALATVALWAPSAALAYIDIPPATLGRMCDATMSITLMRVEKLDKARGRIVFRAVRDLKGNGPSDVVKHELGKDSEKRQAIVAWADAGKEALHFASASRSYSYTYIDGYWYSSSYADGWWRFVRCEPQLLRCFCGTTESLNKVIAEMLSGKEVIVPALADATGQRVWRIRSTVKLLDHNAKRDFVAWGSATGMVVSVEKDKMTIKVGDRKQDIALKTVRLMSADGKPLPINVANPMPGTAMEISEIGGKIAELRFLK